MSLIRRRTGLRSRRPCAAWVSSPARERGDDPDHSSGSSRCRQWPPSSSTNSSATSSPPGTCQPRSAVASSAGGSDRCVWGGDDHGGQVDLGLLELGHAAALRRPAAISSGHALARWPRHAGSPRRPSVDGRAGRPRTPPAVPAGRRPSATTAAASAAQSRLWARAVPPAPGVRSPGPGPAGPAPPCRRTGGETRSMRAIAQLGPHPVGGDILGRGSCRPAGWPHQTADRAPSAASRLGQRGPTRHQVALRTSSRAAATRCAQRHPRIAGAGSPSLPAGHAVSLHALGPALRRRGSPVWARGRSRALELNLTLS